MGRPGTKSPLHFRAWARPGAAAAGAGVAGGGRSGRIEALELTLGAERHDNVGLRLARDVLRNLVLHVGERRQRLGAQVFELDDVPAKLAFHRRGDFARLQLERSVGEFRNHAVLGEIAEIAAFLAGTGILRHVGRDLCEVLAGLQPRHDRIRLVFLLDEDVAGARLLLGRDALDGLVEELLHRFGRGGLLGFRAEIIVEKQLVLEEGYLALEIGVGAQLGLASRAGDELQVGDIADEIVPLLGIGDLRRDTSRRRPLPRYRGPAR